MQIRTCPGVVCPAADLLFYWLDPSVIWLSFSASFAVS